MNCPSPAAASSRKRAAAAATFLLALAFLFSFSGSCSSGGGGGTVLPAPLIERHAIDGIVDFSTLPTTTHQAVAVLDSLGTGTLVTTTTLTWAVANDERNLYLALEWTDDTGNAFDPAAGLTDFDGVIVMFDNDGNGSFDANEDAHRLVMNIYSSYYSDIHAVASGADDTDRIGDGRGKMTRAGAGYQAEFLIPLEQDAAGEDGVLTANTRFNIMILDHVQVAIPSGNSGSLSGTPGSNAGADSGAWPLLPFAVPAAHDQPVIPSNLTGLIAFISDHENPAGELYLFNPVSKIVTRVTHTTGLYMDGVSLSHDRTKIAFYGGPSALDYSTWEIYTINTDGTGLRTLTTNSLLDGHPAWSPDDGAIVYASFREGGRASLVLMTAATGSEIADLTPDGWNDNDPDWLPDGRIVFKTDRFGTAGSPHVRIAVMNPDGSMVAQLTNSPGTSDHDPTGTSTVVVFERFTKATDYSTDPSSIYSAWNLVEARTDGSGERTLLADGWINWLPIHDPSREYLVYLKSVGYTDARLMTKDGRDLGRLIPGVTRIRYIDWK